MVAAARWWWASLDGAITPRVEALHRAFLDFDPNAIVTPNIWGFLWGKLAYGAQLFVTALTNEAIADASPTLPIVTSTSPLPKKRWP